MEMTYDLAGQVIGMAMKVHGVLGAGFVESVYENALCLDLAAAGIIFSRQAPVQVRYPMASNFVNSVKSVKKFLGFTILELLVAMTVMALLLVLLLNIVNSATKLWRENENRVNSYREARAALGIMSRDLQNALTGATNMDHFLVNASAFQKISAIGGVITNTNSGSALFALSALPAKAQESGTNRSDVCQVGYFIAYNRTAASANPSLNLYRYFRSSDSTFTSLTDNTLFVGATIGASGEELLARNITRFTIRPLDLVVSTATNGTNLTTNTSFVPFNPTPANRLPNIVEVSITAVNQDASKRLNNLADWTATNGATYSNIIAPVQQTFTTRIRLNKP